MPNYKAPLDDMRFVLNEVLDVSQLSKFEGYENADTDTVNSMLGMVAQFSEEVLAPLNMVGDAEGCTYDRATKSVKTPNGFKEAYQQFCENGLTAVTCDEKYGGLSMPVTVGTALGEMYCSANLAFGMYPGLSHGAYNALAEYGSDELKEEYLHKLTSGEWTGTMCLTEPGAGTDLGLIKTKAEEQGDGSYNITGTKIFISAGEHDLAGNIVHLVLAKIDAPDTPEGIKGISLFAVPKHLPDAQGNPGDRNPAFCERLEEKMGIHGNSTCEMSFEGAKGFLIGEKHKGMKAMFVMMNEARLGVGLQGLGLSEVAYQNALTYAQDRKQGAKIDEKAAKGTAPESTTIIKHPDVRRELLSIKSQTEGARMLAYWTAMQLDISHKHPDEKARNEAKKVLDFMTPIVKAHFTDNAVDNTNSAIQVFGGHGYIKEHGMEQFNRDDRITRLYEGTNGIQPLDLLCRKVMMQKLMPSYLKPVEADIKAAKKSGVPSELTRPVEQAARKLKSATRRLQMKGAMGKMKGDMGPTMREAAGMATDYLKLASLVSMGHMWVKMVDVAQQRLDENAENKDFYETKIKTARFYMDKIMPQMHTYDAAMKSGVKSLVDIAEEHFAHNQGTVAEKPRQKPQPPAKKKAIWPF
ncbi:MAG: acyl-CoA dehydrogenase C-terminal domain-containing protein [Alphaproteobacteria bacterium]|nr:acyl-CoA dehydrogenase C-terminal domain-containing protein [Alphaproteobacteria bacterium]